MELKVEKVTTAKEDLALKICQAVHKSGGYVFGGFCRDVIAGIPFTDIDIFLELNGLLAWQVISNFEKEIVNLGFTIKFIRNTQKYGLDVNRYLIKNGNLSIKIDVVLQSKEIPNPWVKGVDANINWLRTVKIGSSLNEIECIKYELGGKSWTYHSIIEDIKNRYYEPFNCSEKRHLLLQKKGFRLKEKEVEKDDKKQFKTNIDNIALLGKAAKYAADTRRFVTCNSKFVTCNPKFGNSNFIVYDGEKQKIVYPPVPDSLSEKELSELNLLAAELSYLMNGNMENLKDLDELRKILGSSKKLEEILMKDISSLNKDNVFEYIKNLLDKHKEDEKKEILNEFTKVNKEIKSSLNQAEDNLKENINVEKDVERIKSLKEEIKDTKDMKMGKAMQDDNQENPPVGKLTFFDRTKQDFIDAAFRTGAIELSNISIAGLLEILKGNLSEEDFKVFERVLNHPIGRGLLMFGLGNAVTYTFENDKAQKLAQELRVQGITEELQLLVMAVQQVLLPELRKHLAALPSLTDDEVKKTRITSKVEKDDDVEEDTEINIDEEDDEEEEAPVLRNKVK